MPVTAATSAPFAAQCFEKICQVRYECNCVGTVVEAVAKQKRVSIVQQLVQLQSPLVRGGQHDVPLRIIQANGNPVLLNVQVVPI